MAQNLQQSTIALSPWSNHPWKSILATSTMEKAIAACNLATTSGTGQQWHQRCARKNACSCAALIGERTALQYPPFYISIDPVPIDATLNCSPRIIIVASEDMFSFATNPATLLDKHRLYIIATWHS
jgi:hypothetical protein